MHTDPIFFQAGGFLVLGVGIWTVVDKSYIEVLLRNELYMTMAYVLIVAGVLVVFVSLVGCLGAVKEVSDKDCRKSARKHCVQNCKPKGCIE